MQASNNPERNEDIISKLDYIRDLFIRNEDDLALKELDPVLEKMGIVAQEMSVSHHGVIQQGLVETLHCLKTKDYVRLMDILIFEIKPLFNYERG
jgi:hypothetical protein